MRSTCLLALLVATSLNQATAQEYYIIGRYYCVNVNDPSQDKGDCEITTRANSCPEAKAAQQSTIAQVGDPCRQCGNVTDNSKRWKQTVDFVQDGPCRGFQ